MARKKKETSVEVPAQKVSTTDPALIEALKSLGLVFSEAIEKNKPKEKVRIHQPRNAWSTPGVPKAKLKRKLYHHGILLDPEMLTNAQIELANQLKPGRFCDGNIVVQRRRDKGVNIDYAVKTASQRLKLNQYGITSFDVLMQRLIDEANNPKAYRSPEDFDE